MYSYGKDYDLSLSSNQITEKTIHKKIIKTCANILKLAASDHIYNIYLGVWRTTSLFAFKSIGCCSQEFQLVMEI